MGLKGRAAPRKRKGSSKGSKGLGKDELLRRLRVALLNLNVRQNGNALVAFGGLLLLLNLLYFVPRRSSLRVTGRIPQRVEDAQEVLAQAEIAPLERIVRDLGGVGAPLKSESVFMKKSGIAAVKVSAASGEIAELTAVLGRIETDMNKGWNVSSPKALPLGQLGYVKRDLPVYKDGLQRQDIAVLPRPKSGLFSVEQLRGNSYNMILCLSFNTDHCFDPTQYAAIGETRKVNRIQNLRDTVWSKHKFCRTMSSATKGLTDLDLLSFTFPCWVMPGDYDRMVRYSRDNSIEMWIAKPRSLGAGMGIYIVSDMGSLEHERSTSNVVQTYLEDPHLIEKVGLDGTRNKYKWDMRSYVLVTSVTPLRAYVYSRGLVRISTSPYGTNCKDNITACLTNTSLNKKVEGAQLKDITWSFKKLKEYLVSRGEEAWEDVFPRIQRAIGLTLLSAESELLKHFTPKGFRCENCYQLLGVDLLFDSALQPKVVEINGEPNLKLTNNGKTHYDFTKRNMARDLMALVFHRQPQRAKAAARLQQWARAALSETGGAVGTVPIGEDHLRYVLATMREHAKLGAFRPVYPNDGLAEPYGRYLRFLRDKEAKKEAGDADSLVHADGRRYRLHQVVTLLQNARALAAVTDLPANAAAASATAAASAPATAPEEPAAAAQQQARKRRARSRRAQAEEASDEDPDMF